MYRVLVPLVFAVAMLLGIMGGAPGHSVALSSAATPEATPAPTPPAELCTETDPGVWMPAIDVRPPRAAAALTRPLDVTGDQDLYLVVWTLRPGTCIPYSAEGNQKDGAVILVVQQGIIEYTAQPFGEGSTAEVRWGHADSEDGTVLDFGTTLTLYPGDWVTQNDQVWFTFQSVGGESAVVLKAVWAKLPPDIGCGGGCR